MKSILLVVTLFNLFFSGSAFADLKRSSFAQRNCSFRGVPAWGRVKIVEQGEDLRVKALQAGNCLQVRFVQTEPAACGQWRLVQSGENVKIKFVESGEDFCVRILNP